ncbi:chromosome transmission fidelity protein 18 homolog, partial [Neolamprologus brichardi]|uniref:chromosome transmission fidelity protein 18 homolog n=1 Tax=Neolamprologus brichardi TaxID=32507 RepID=UPI0003EC3D5C
YVPALRPLRQQAFLLAFPQTQPSRLTQRLAEISLRQGLKADTGTLMSLCEKTDNDIRSCINTLQFLHSRGVKQLDSKTIQSISVGQKDQNKGLFHLWQEIFQLPRTKRKRVGEGFEDGPGSGSGAHRFQHILHLASSSGEYEKVSQGLYDNYLSMRVRDPNLQSACEALDWLAFSDKLSHVILHGQNFSLMKYLPFLSITFHFLFAHTNVPRISYPHSQHEASSRLLSCKNALSTMLADTPASIRARISQLSLTLDILTLLLDIICPKLRPLEWDNQLVTSAMPARVEEQRDAQDGSFLQARCDEVLVTNDWGLPLVLALLLLLLIYTFLYLPSQKWKLFVIVRHLTGFSRVSVASQVHLCLLRVNNERLVCLCLLRVSRRVEEVVRFPGLPPRRQLTYQAKQTISREMEQEKMRRAEQLMLLRNPAPKAEDKKSAGPKASRNHQQRLENIVKQTTVESR